MKDITIKFLPKDAIFPAFGRYNYDTRTIEIRDGLTRFEQCSLLIHEFGHSDDLGDNEGFICKELESIVMSIFYPAIGTLLIAFKSLTPDRLKWYWQRIKKGE